MVKCAVQFGLSSDKWPLIHCLTDRDVAMDMDLKGQSLILALAVSNISVIALLK